MIKVEHISKQFKKVKAVDDVSLEVKKGEIVCLMDLLVQVRVQF